MSKTFNKKLVASKLGSVAARVDKAEIESIPDLQVIADQIKDKEDWDATREMAITVYTGRGNRLSTARNKAGRVLRVIRGLQTHNMPKGHDFEDVLTDTAPTAGKGAPKKSKKERAASVLKRAIRDYGYAAVAEAFEELKKGRK